MGPKCGNIKIPRNVILESDARDIVQQILVNSDSHRGSLLIWRIKELMRMNWNVQINWIPRSSNQVVDSLAKKGILSSNFLDVCPMYLRTLVTNELLGSQFPSVLQV